MRLHVRSIIHHVRERELHDRLLICLANGVKEIFRGRALVGEYAGTVLNILEMILNCRGYRNDRTLEMSATVDVEHAGLRSGLLVLTSPHYKRMVRYFYSHHEVHD